MEQVRLGSTGLLVSEICLGMMSYGDPAWREWVLPGEQAKAFVAASVERGVTFFDTADMYSVGVSEEATGAALRSVFARREEYVLATKVFQRMGDAPNDGGLSRGHILDSVDASLRRLGVDHIDLYQTHRWDPNTPIEETMEALHDCVRAGKVRYLGASSMYAWQFAKAQRVAAQNGWTEFVTMQPHYNLLYREEEREMLPLCVDSGVGVLPWSPLARGRLARTGEKAKDSVRGQSDPMQERYELSATAIVDAVGRVAERRGVARAQIALAWLLAQPAVTSPIIGATKLEHLEDALAATTIELTEEECDELEAPYRPVPIHGHR